MVRTWLRAPAVRFAVGGIALFALDALRAPGRTPVEPGLRRAPVVISAADRERLRAEFTGETGLVPTAAEERHLLERAIDEEILYREARALGLHRGDRSIRMRLVQKMRAVADDPGVREEALHAEALELGFDQDDPVVRRILAEKLRLRIRQSAATPEPSREELQDWLDRHRGDFAQPPLVRFGHAFLSFDRRGDAAERDALALLDSLRREAAPPVAPERRGDPFWLDPAARSISLREIEKLLGPEFASQMLRVPPGAWAGPLRSAYGLHLVWVHEREPARIAPLDAVRGQVGRALVAERGERRVEETLHRLRARYRVRVEGPAPREAGGA
jgi:hypothetical protein